MRAACVKLRDEAAGFTLVEVLVALLILGILTALGYGTYRQARISAERTEQSQARTREIEFGVRMMLQDFEQIAPRPIRQPIGDARTPALNSAPAALGSDSASNSSDAFGSSTSIDSDNVAKLVDLTRAGWSNTAGVQRGTLQRVSYRLEKNVLKRSYQAVLDPTLSNVSTDEDLLTKVKSIQIRYLDANHDWVQQWPPAGATQPENLVMRPVAIEVTIEFVDWGKIRRIVEVAG
jgi:general secretion pathway protein J